MRRAAFPLLILLAALFAVLAACETDIEGNEPGECEDGADNDSDGYFDCADRDCWGAPACGGPPGQDDDDAGDDDDATGDDDDATGDDDDATGDDDDAGDDDDSTTGDGMTPIITNVEYVFINPNFTFTVTAHDPDDNFGVPLLLWSVDGAAQPAQQIGSVPLPQDIEFDIQLTGATIGQTYQVLFAIQDADGRTSDGYSLAATAQ